MDAPTLVTRGGRYVAILAGSLAIAFLIAILAEVAGINLPALAE
jgi:hypothetical protein